jgi:hypothetical protein
MVLIVGGKMADNTTTPVTSKKVIIGPVPY